MEKLPDNKKQEKLAKVFRAVISAGLVAPVFVSVSACEKAMPVVEEAQTTATTIETTPQTTTQETVAPTTEATPQTVEYQGSVFPLPEGSEANPQTGEIFALVDNPYGVPAETKIGQCIIDAFELDGKMENSIALTPSVIEYLQKKMMEEKHEFRYALPFYPTKGIKITEAEDKSLENNPQIKDLLWDKPKVLAISNLPLETVIHSVVTTPNFVIWKQSESNDWYVFNLSARNDIYNTQYSLDFNGQRVDVADVGIEVIGAEIIPLELNKKFPKKGIPAIVMESKIGTALAKIKEKKFISDSSFKENDKVSMVIWLQMSQLKFNENENKNVLVGLVKEGSPYLLTIGDEVGNKEGIVVSMLSNE